MQNVHLKNSELGIIVTDEAPWGDGVAEKIGKAHGIFTMSNDELVVAPLF